MVLTSALSRWPDCPQYREDNKTGTDCPFKLQYLWVYPDRRAQEEKYGLNPHNDGTADTVLVMP